MVVSKILKRKRSKTLTVMLLPLLLFVGAIGWFMYSIGSRKSVPKAKQSPTKTDYVTLLPIILEDDQEIRN